MVGYPISKSVCRVKNGSRRNGNGAGVKFDRAREVCMRVCYTIKMSEILRFKHPIRGLKCDQTAGLREQKGFQPLT